MILWQKLFIGKYVRSGDISKGREMVYAKVREST